MHRFADVGAELQLCMSARARRACTHYSNFKLLNINTAFLVIRHLRKYGS